MVKKRETIDGSTIGWYKNTKTEYVYENLVERYECPKDERVVGPWIETCAKSKSETVDGGMTQTIKIKHVLNVEGPALHTYQRKQEHVTGDSVTTIDGEKHEAVNGDKRILMKGNHASITKGVTKDVFIGEKASVNIGANISQNVILKHETSLGASVTITAGIRATKDTFKADHSVFRTQKIDFDLDKAETKVSNAACRIMGAAFHLVK